MQHPDKEAGGLLGRILAGCLAVLLLLALAHGAQPSRVVHADVILKKIELGHPVEYDNVTIEGDLNISGLDLPRIHVNRTYEDVGILQLPEYPKTVASPIVIDNSTILGSVNLNGTVLCNDSDFYNTTFEGNFFAQGTQFNQNATFILAKFNQPTDFWGAQFKQTVSAEVILKEVEQGQWVYLNTTTVVGDLNVSGLKLPRIRVKGTEYREVASPISICNSTILGSMNLNGTVLCNDLDFYNTTFEGDFFAHGTQFNQDVDFLKAQFKQTVSAEVILKEIEQGQWVYLNNTTVVGDLNISELNLSHIHVKRTYWDTCVLQLPKDPKKVEATISISDSTILGSVNLSGTVLDNDSDFWGTTFEGNFISNRAQFNKTAVFCKAKFNQNADFSFANFSQTADFWRAQFDQTANFSYAKFNDKACFEYAGILDAYFDNSQFFGEALFYWVRINGTLSLIQTKYDKLNIRWSNITDLNYDDTAYYLLIENFKKLGFTDDANDCYYSYRCKHGWEPLNQNEFLHWFFDSLAWLINALEVILGQLSGFLRWLFDSLAWWSYGYGLRPERPLGWSVFIIITSGLFFWRSKTIRRKDAESKDVSLREAVLLGATYFTSGASNIISVTPDEFAPVGRARYVIVLLRLSGWVFFALFLTSLRATVSV